MEVCVIWVIIFFEISFFGVFEEIQTGLTSGSVNIERIFIVWMNFPSKYIFWTCSVK